MSRSEHQEAGLLFQGFQDGAEYSFDHFFNLYYKSLVYFAAKIIVDRTAAEDIVTERFVKLWERRNSITDEQHLRNWLYLTTRNDCLRWIAQQDTAIKKQDELYRDASPFEADISDLMIKAETIRQLHTTIAELPDQCRKVFEKLYVEGNSVKETAAELELTISTINNQKARGIKLLRAKLGGSLTPILVFVFFIVECVCLLY